MNMVSVGDRLKYYRKLLNISQKELADNKVSSNLISLIERGRVPLSTVTASILVDNINKISIGRGINLSLSIKDLMISDEDYIRKVSLERLNGQKSVAEVNRIYTELFMLSQKFGNNSSKAILESNIADKFFQMQQYEECVKHFEKYIDILGDLSSIQDNEWLSRYGIALYNIGRLEKSFNIFSNILKNIENHEYDFKRFDAYYIIACISYENKNFKSVVENLKEAIAALNPMESIEERINELSEKIIERNKEIVLNLYKDIKTSPISIKKEGSSSTLNIFEESITNGEFNNIFNKDYLLMLLILLENYINANDLEKAKNIISSARKHISNQ